MVVTCPDCNGEHLQALKWWFGQDDGPLHYWPTCDTCGDSGEVEGEDHDLDSIEEAAE